MFIIEYAAVMNFAKSFILNLIDFIMIDSLLILNPLELNVIFNSESMSESNRSNEVHFSNDDH